MPIPSSDNLQFMRAKEQFYQYRDAAKAAAVNPRLFTLRNSFAGLHIVVLVATSILLVLLGVVEDPSWRQILDGSCSAGLVVAVAFAVASAFLHIRIQRIESDAESRVWSELTSTLRLS